MRQRQSIGRVLSSAPEVADGFYFAAKVSLFGGKIDAAQGYLERALQLGYSKSLAAADPQLREIRALPRIQAHAANAQEIVGHDQAKRGRNEMSCS